VPNIDQELRLPSALAEELTALVPSTGSEAAEQSESMLQRLEQFQEQNGLSVDGALPDRDQLDKR
jgi:hypothetical protein